MLPTLINLGPVTIHSYGVMIAVAFLAALYLIKRDCPKYDLDPDVVGDATFWTLVVGLLGTRILHIIMFPESYAWSDPLGWIAVWRGGLVFQGAFPAAFIFCTVFLRMKGLPFWRTVDVACPYMALGHGIGRIGCFLNGCCYGERSDIPWAIPFRRVPWDLTQNPVGSPPFLDHCKRFGLSYSDHWSYPVHPTQLYSVFGLIALCFLLLYLRKRWRPFDGYLMATYIMFYGVLRFIIEFYRGDGNPAHWGDLSDQQYFSLGFILGGLVLSVVLYWWSKRTRVEAPQPARAGRRNPNRKKK
jgi:phosphatidylglycerol:prolipoprotein diacylglycerol transferase